MAASTQSGSFWLGLASLTGSDRACYAIMYGLLNDRGYEVLETAAIVNCKSLLILLAYFAERPHPPGRARRLGMKQTLAGS